MGKNQEKWKINLKGTVCSNDLIKSWLLANSAQPGLLEQRYLIEQLNHFYRASFIGRF